MRVTGKTTILSSVVIGEMTVLMWMIPDLTLVYLLALANCRSRSRATFIMRMRESPSANLQHCRKSVCSNPVPKARCYQLENAALFG